MRKRETESEKGRQRECTRCRRGVLGISGWRLFVTPSHSHRKRLDLMTSSDSLCHRYLVPWDRGRGQLERKQNSEMPQVRNMMDREGEYMWKEKAQGRVKLS